MKNKALIGALMKKKTDLAKDEGKVAAEKEPAETEAKAKEMAAKKKKLPTPGSCHKPAECSPPPSPSTS